MDRPLNNAEARYSTFNRELLACVATISHFRFLVEGCGFFILSDHKPLRPMCCTRCLTLGPHYRSVTWPTFRIHFQDSPYSRIRECIGRLTKQAVGGGGPTTCGCSRGASCLNRAYQLGRDNSQPSHVLTAASSTVFYLTSASADHLPGSRGVVGCIYRQYQASFPMRSPLGGV